MFSKETYIERRKALKSLIKEGIAVFPSNAYVPYNYPHNVYTFRQDSAFLYFFGHNEPGLTGVIDFDSGTDSLFGTNREIDNIIWMGELPTVREFTDSVGVTNAEKASDLKNYFSQAKDKGRNVHFLPAYRAQTQIELSELLKISVGEVKNQASEELIKAVVSICEIKTDEEVEQMENAGDIAYDMHTAVMKHAKEGVTEQELAGMIEGIAISKGKAVSFPVILSQNGNILHNDKHDQVLKNGRLLITDAGAENNMNYASDITRVVPVSGKFTSKQKHIYETVLSANMAVYENSKPGVLYKDMHILAVTKIAEGLKEAGILKGNTQDIVANGAHALFMPHGLGHAIGLDVHDMEGFGEDYVGYDDKVKRSDQFGFAFLRMGKELKKGFAITNEPGVYFIPELINIWKSENKFKEFINYDKAAEYLDFGGIRIEDDMLITETGCRLIGKPIPKTVADVEAMMAQGR